MVALMAQALDARPGHRVLEVGGGSGYHAAVLARLVAPAGRVVSVEYVPALAEAARAALAPLGLPVDVEVGDGSLGWPPGAPYDRISVAAAAPSVPPPLVAQLAPGGLLLIPVGPRDLSSLLRVRKMPDGSTQTEDLGPCLFVPLLGAHGWPA
jgi:protein-L-isoaspartate(D-aspartate) O-methyltransferase